MMYFTDDNDLNEINARLHGVVETDFGENVSSSFDAFVANNQWNSEFGALTDKLAEQEEYLSGIGEDLPVNYDLLPHVSGDKPTIDMGTIQDAYNDRLAYDKRIDELRAEHPNLFTYSELHQQVLDEAVAAREKNKEVASRANGWGQAGQFVGAAGGAVTDGMNIAAMAVAFPLAFESLGVFMLSEGLLAMTSETAIQTSVVPFKERQGMSEEEALDEARDAVLMAGAGGALTAGALRGAASGIKALWKRFHAEPEIVVRQMEEVRDRLPPEQRQNLDTIQNVLSMEARNIHGRTPEGISAFISRVGEVEDGIRNGNLEEVVRGQSPLEARTEALDPFEGVTPNQYANDVIRDAARLAVARLQGRVDDTATRLLNEGADNVDDAIEVAMRQAEEVEQVRITGVLDDTISERLPVGSVVPGVRMRDGSIHIDTDAANGTEIIQSLNFSRNQVDRVGFVADGNFFTVKRAAKRAAQKAVREQPQETPFQAALNTRMRSQDNVVDMPRVQRTLEEEVAVTERAASGEYDQLVEDNLRRFISENPDFEVIVETRMVDGREEYVTRTASEILDEADEEINQLRAVRMCMLGN